MTGITIFVFALSMLIAGSSSSFGQDQQTYPGPQPSGAFVLPAAERSIQPAPFPARSVATPVPRFYGGFGRECPGYTKSRRARLHGNLVLERLLARGVDDPLSQPVYLAATRRENALSGEIDACNRDWVTAHSIYRGAVILAIADESTRDLASLLLTILGFEVTKPSRPDDIFADIGKALAEEKRVVAVLLDTAVATPELTDNVVKMLRSSAPWAVVVPSHPRPNDPLVRRFRRDGFAYLLPQPYHPAMLWKAVNRITGSSGRRPL